MPSFALILIATANIVSLYYAVSWLAKPQSQTRSALKVLPVLLLLIAGLLGQAPVVILAGLAACMVGDWFLSLEGEQNFLYGLSAFLLGHLLYIAFFTGSFNPALVTDRVAIETGIVLIALIAVVLLRLWPWLAGMKIPVVIYAFTIALMAYFAKLANPGFMVLAGIALFVVSDIILANDKFTPLTNTPIRKAMPYAVWLLYFIGQSLIIAGLTQTI